MSREHTAGNCTAADIAGYATELTAWRFLRDVSGLISSSDIIPSLDTIMIEKDTFVSSNKSTEKSAEDKVWMLGECTFELLIGAKPFNGKGMEGQEETTPIPALPESKVSRKLSSLIKECMAFDQNIRPSIEKIHSIASTEIELLEKECANIKNLRINKKQNRKMRMKAFDFWPEEMVSIAKKVLMLLLLMVVTSVGSLAQGNQELTKLVNLTMSMRKQSNRQDVLKQLMQDTKWTLMDELAYHKQECSTKDKVAMFGMNDIAREIAQKEKGIVNHGNRFKHSADGKHPYSFIEITVKAGQEVHYTVKGHSGMQDIMFVPYDSKQQYLIFCYNSKDSHIYSKDANGNTRMVLRPVDNKAYTFQIVNKGKKNASFVVITYNSQK